MFKSSRREELERKELELRNLKRVIWEIKSWCGSESPEIGFAMLFLEGSNETVDGFRERLRRGEFTLEKFIEEGGELYEW